MIVAYLLAATLMQAVETPALAPPSLYTLGVGDQLMIRAVSVEELGTEPIRIDSSGMIDLPMVGRFEVAGKTAEALEVEIESRLKRYVKYPDVSISVKETQSHPVSVLGAVQTPGVYQIQGAQTLFQVLSLAGGLRPDAGNAVRITRHREWGAIPLVGATDDETGTFSVASVNVKSILAATNPADNILIRPDDVISVPRADLIYVVGAVKKSGGFILGENETLSTLQVLSLAEGLDSLAAQGNAKIMRAVPGKTARVEIPLDLKKILAGKKEDIALQANDILFVPTSAAKNAAMRTLGAAIQIGTGVAVYRR
jgi:polysaccharide export outer membrane protein